MSNKALIDFAPQAVLDTLKFKDGKIFLKEFHAQRSYEALIFKNAQVNSEQIFSLYDQLEHRYVEKIRPNQILRLLFPIENSTTQFKIEAIEAPYFAKNPIVEVNSLVKFPSGLGEQNFKWSQREVWKNLLATKNSSTDDVVAINEKNQVTETSRCNLFCFDAAHDLVLTPSLDAGCINGVYRRFVIAEKHIDLPSLGRKKVIEQNILSTDLKKYSLFLANSIREVLPSRLLNKEISK